jgi:AcrR family transcriptional regulator
MPPRHASPNVAKGITPDAIISAAAQLTRDKGLEKWTIRDLAQVLDVYSTVIYHHVGDRNTVANAVVDRVVAQYRIPEPDLPWRAWWRQFLSNLREVFIQYPGTARRVALNGPSPESGGPTIDRAMRTLLRVGFEQDEAAMACRVLIIQGCLFISHEDDRRHTSGVTDDLSGTRGTQAPHFAGRESLQESVQDRLKGPEKNRDYFGELFDYAIDRMIDGVDKRLEEIRGV